ncbi:MAG: OBAP family protein [Nitrobacter sp.]
MTRTEGNNMAWLPAKHNRRGFMGLVGSATAGLTCSCFKPALAQQPTELGGEILGAPKTTQSKMLGMGADILQGQSPISSINMYLNGFHFYADDMGRQIEAHHFCHHVNEEFFQCVIYDGNKTDSRLIGIEYIVSERIFKTLPDEEKALWHSHRHEATSGELVMPGIPETVEHTAIGTLVSTYGKTWHTWQIDRDSELPLGIPQLMMGFTQDGQLKPAIIQSRDRELGISTDKDRKNRADLARSAPPVQPGADSWQTGQSPQLALNKVPLKNKRG